MVKDDKIREHIAEHGFFCMAVTFHSGEDPLLFAELAKNKGAIPYISRPMQKLSGSHVFTWIKPLSHSGKYEVGFAEANPCINHFKVESFSSFVGKTTPELNPIILMSLVRDSLNASADSNE